MSEQLDKSGTVKYKSYWAEAECDDCDFRQSRKNAHGLAAQHHYRTGHTVRITITNDLVMTKHGSEFEDMHNKIHS